MANDDRDLARLLATFGLLQSTRQITHTVNYQARDSLGMTLPQDAPKADTHKQSFRFMDLESDIRHLIYEELLTMNERNKCQIQILATCKQIQSEAEKVFYGCNTFKVEIGFQSTFLCGIKVVEHDRWGPSNGYDMKWPAVTRKFRHMKLCLWLDRASLEGHPEMIDFMIAMSGARNAENAVEPVLHSLCEFLGTDHHLQTLMLDLHVPQEYCDSDQDSEGPYVLPVDCYSVRLIQKGDLRFTASGVVDPISWHEFSPALLESATVRTPNSARRRVFRTLRGVANKINKIRRRHPDITDDDYLGEVEDDFGLGTFLANATSLEPYLSTLKSHRDINLSVSKLVPCLRFWVGTVDAGWYSYSQFSVYGLGPAVHKLLRAIVDLQIALRDETNMN